MPDVTGWRAKFGVIVPSTNTVVEHDFNRMAPPGVTFHAGRMYIERPALDCRPQDTLSIETLGCNRQAMKCVPRRVAAGEIDFGLTSTRR